MNGFGFWSSAASAALSLGFSSFSSSFTVSMSSSEILPLTALSVWSLESVSFSESSSVSMEASPAFVLGPLPISRSSLARLPGRSRLGMRLDSEMCGSRMLLRTDFFSAAGAASSTVLFSASCAGSSALSSAAGVSSLVASSAPSGFSSAPSSGASSGVTSFLENGFLNQPKMFLLNLLSVAGVSSAVVSAGAVASSAVAPFSTSASVLASSSPSAPSASVVAGFLLRVKNPGSFKPPNGTFLGFTSRPSGVDSVASSAFLGFSFSSSFFSSSSGMLMISSFLGSSAAASTFLGSLSTKFSLDFFTSSSFLSMESVSLGSSDSVCGSAAAPPSVFSSVSPIVQCLVIPAKRIERENFVKFPFNFTEREGIKWE